MKHILFLSLILSSFSTFALDTVGGVALAISATALTTEMTGGLPKEEAKQVINNSQDFITSGRLSVLLEDKINTLMVLDNSLSVEQALDLVIEQANNVLLEN